MKNINPFVIGHYVSEDYFCDREKETKQILNAAENQRNISLISHRRYGKTGLILHAFNKLKKNKNIRVFYIDLLHTKSLRDFNTQLAKAVLDKFDSKTKKLINSFAQFVKSLRPVVSFDPVSGHPEIEISYFENNSPIVTLQEIFNYLGSQNEKIIIALDEFQQIVNYAEKNTEALLRSQIQLLSNTNFIFSGSQKHLLTQIFSDYGRPFYQSTEYLFLEKISPDKYRIFIRKQFKKKGLVIDDDTIDLILKLMNGHTFYVQFLCNRLYSSNIQKLSEQTVLDTLDQILTENEPIYYNLQSLLTKHQLSLLIALANENGLSKPTSKKIIDKYKLSGASTVKASITVLLGKEIIYKELNKYYIYDVFFSKYLRRM